MRENLLPIVNFLASGNLFRRLVFLNERRLFYTFATGSGVFKAFGLAAGCGVEWDNMTRLA
jgi:hypothetical protein